MSNDLSRAKQLLLKQWRDGVVQVPSSRAPITAGSPSSRARASWAQGELVRFVEMLMPGTTRNNISYAGLVDADIDPVAFGTAVDMLGQRHEALRTALVFEDDAVWQLISSQPQITLETADFSDLPESAQARATARANELAATPFDLTAGPLARVALFRLAPDRHMVVIIAHHTVADGWSLAIAMQEVTAIYHALIAGTEPQLPDLPIQYRDYARWQLQWVESSDARAHAGYWEQRLRHYVAPRLPKEPEAVAAGRPAGMTPVTLPAELTTSVREFASRHDVSLFTVLLSAFGLLLAERTGSTDIAVGTAVANRHLPETHPLIGLFASVVPLRFTVRPDDVFRDLVQKVRTCSAEALSHEIFPLTLYMGAVEPGRNLKERPLYTAVLVLQPPMLPFTIAGETFTPVLLDRGAAASDFALHLWDQGAAISGTMGYSASTLSGSTAAAMFTRYLDILARAIDSPDKPAAEL